MEWNIGNIKIKNKIVIAPMAGLSDHTFRKIAESFDAGLVYTEMISAEAIVRDNEKTLSMLVGVEGLSIPVGVQLFGGNAKILAKAAKIINNLYPKNVFIDINFGCPVPKIAIKNQAGSALLKNPDQIEAIVKAVVCAVSVPVTAKIRSGWDEKSINAVEVAQKIEKAGASAITVHARTRSQGYSGIANWEIIKAVKAAVTIPVIGNGDIKSCFDAKKMLAVSGCDAVMIGRGLLGNPWLIKECTQYLADATLPESVSADEKIVMLKKHYQLLSENTNDNQAIFQIRSHAHWYIKGLPGSVKIKNLICQTKNSQELFAVLDAYLCKLKDN